MYSLAITNKYIETPTQNNILNLKIIINVK